MQQNKTKNAGIVKEIGHVVSFFSGVAKLEGLPHIFVNEVLVNSDGKQVALVIGFDEHYVDALFFDVNFNQDEPVYRSFKPFSISSTKNYIGRIIDGFGQPIDGKGEILGEEKSVFADAPPIVDRSPVTTPLSTGIKIIDTSLPIGRGQRELIIGDRKLGKSTIAVDTVLNQKNEKRPVYCIYVVTGQREKKVDELISIFRENNSFLYSTIVAAPVGSSFAEQYLAPFVGCSIAEYFRDNGMDALIVYDDFSKHAKVYRDVSLILERAPGREAYPGDVFSLHATLLERAAQLSETKGGGSLSALPIIETQEADITSFIPTNIISITDGQIYLERGLFKKQFLPAVNVGLSVSRVGSQAQPSVLKEITGGIRLTLSQHKELQKLSQLETEVSKETQKKIYHGELILELLKQKKHTNIAWEEQAVLFYTVKAGFFDDLNKEHWSDFESYFLKLIRSCHGDILNQIRSGDFDDKLKEKLSKTVQEFKETFIAEL